MVRFLVLGTANVNGDDAAISLIPLLRERFPEHEFVEFDPAEGSLRGDVFIIDVVKGIDDVQILNENDVDKLRDFPKASAHDFDLAFSIKLAMIAGEVRRVRIVALPFGRKVDVEKVCRAVECATR